MVLAVTVSDGKIRAKINTYMDKVRVILREPTPAGRLYYRNDPEIEDSLIYIRNPNLGTGFNAYTILVHYLVLLDVGPDLVLRNVDFMIRPKNWTVSPSITLPQISKMADIGFQPFDEYESSKKFVNSNRKGIHADLPIFTEADPLGSYVYFMFDKQVSTKSIWIGLSDQCAALIDGDFLKGFFVDRRPVNNVA